MSATEIEEKIATFQALLVDGWSVTSARGRAKIPQSFLERYLKGNEKYEELVKKYQRQPTRVLKRVKPPRNEPLHQLLSPPNAPDLLPGVVRCLLK